MNIFSRIIAEAEAADTRLGCPSPDYAAQRRRMNAMATMTMSNGFRIPPKGLRLSKGRMTRKELEAGAKAAFQRNLEAEVAFRVAHAGQPGWSIRRIGQAIERHDHLRSS